LIQAFVQMDSEPTATAAKQQFDGQCVYNGCNILRIQYSGMDNCTVKSNSERSWDFTLPCDLNSLPGSARWQAQQDSLVQGGVLGHDKGHGKGGFGGHNPQNQSGYGPGPGQGHDQRSHAVCIVHNLNEEKVHPDELAALFAVYGNVQRVKIMFHKRSTALVQMERPEMCRNAISGLQGAMLFGQELKVEQSKGQGVPPAKAGEDFTKDFTQQPEYNRYRNQALKSFTRSDTLHLGNMPDGTTEDNIKEFITRNFGDDAAMPKRIKFLNDSHHMAAVKFETQAEAIDTLVVCHAKDLNGRSVRIGFGHLKD